MPEPVVSGLRPALASLSGHRPSNARWAYYRGLSSHDKTATYPGLVSDVASMGLPGDYESAHKRWLGLVKQQTYVVITAQTTAALAVGLGAISPIDIGFTLHHTYGVPYLPGSALKGLARRAADHYDLTPADKDTLLDILFGDDAATGSQSAGYVTFWDGWVDPACQNPLQPDVITVHHPQYYSSANAYLLALDAKRPAPPVTAPTDFDDPNPVAFLSVGKNVTFHIALTCGSEPPDAALAWAQAAATIVKYALANLGFGAKTNGGYGTFKIVGTESGRAG
jgi:CRISPR-associated protein Cmr6